MEDNCNGNDVIDTPEVRDIESDVKAQAFGLMSVDFAQIFLNVFVETMISALLHGIEKELAQHKDEMIAFARKELQQLKGLVQRLEDAIEGACKDDEDEDEDINKE